MINSLPNRTSLSPFRKSVTTIDAITTNDSANKKKHQSLKIITGNSTETTNNGSPNNSMSSPSGVRQRLSSLFRSSSPVVTTLKETFNHSNQSLSTNKRGSTASFSAVAKQVDPRQSDQQPTPTLITSLRENHSTNTLSSVSDASSDHMPASPADGSAASTFSQHRKDITDPSFWNPTEKSNVPSLTFSAPPTLPLHQFPIVCPPTSLACQVQNILANALDEIDEEIDLDWEESRNVLRQSLILPNTCERIRL